MFSNLIGGSWNKVLVQEVIAYSTIVCDDSYVTCENRQHEIRGHDVQYCNTAGGSWNKSSNTVQ